VQGAFYRAQVTGAARQYLFFGIQPGISPSQRTSFPRSRSQPLSKSSSLRFTAEVHSFFGNLG